MKYLVSLLLMGSLMDDADIHALMQDVGTQMGIHQSIELDFQYFSLRMTREKRRLTICHKFASEVYYDERRCE